MREWIYYRIIRTPFRSVVGISNGTCLLEVSTDETRIPKNGVPSALPLLLRLEEELNEYFQGRRFSFDFPLSAPATGFQGKIRTVLLGIPYGQTRSYGEIAKQIGIPRGTQAVGQGIHRNPFAILIPCHRVIGKGGDLTGYAGGLDWKRFLLETEKKWIRQ